MRYRRRPEALWRRSLDSVLVLRPGDDEVTRIGGSGLVVWLALDEARSTDELARELSEAFDEMPVDIASDIRTAVDELLARGCVEELS